MLLGKKNFLARTIFGSPPFYLTLKGTKLAIIETAGVALLKITENSFRFQPRIIEVVNQ
ncbi:MAG: hypothetical protein GY765_39810 [bacterium]|nr:hypothetical protein [bacterium]